MVVRRLIKVRCKLADKEADDKQLKDFVKFETNEKSTMISKSKKFIYSLFPPRSKWCHLGRTRQELDSIKRNERKLYYTYLKAVKVESKEKWYANLCNEADTIVKMALNPTEKIPSPTVHVIEKKRKDNIIICRPVCSFDVEIKIVLSLYNKMLTTLFDKYFLPCSYAFRIPKETSLPFQHMNAVKDIQAYRINHIDRPIYVAECDMQKFYDTIDHKVIKGRFNMLFSKIKRDIALTPREFRPIKSWFYSYVDCFGFAEQVLIYNNKPYHKIWDSIKGKQGFECRIEWIDELLKGSNKKARSKRQSLGVPQGGALSGLIANIVMHFVDMAVEKYIGDKDMLYLRFCDDMILLGTNKTEVEEALSVYNKAIKSAKLFPHESMPMKYTHAREFWDGKTRGPYEWGEKGKNTFPWITFVGFDINWKGNLRIRKKSIDKHLAKQHDTIWSLLNRYNNHNPRYQQYSILSSLKSRMIAMSVGRVGLWNYKENPNIHSWAAAFSILDKNPWSVSQMKFLDRHRNLELRHASQYLWKLTCPDKKMTGDHARRGQFYLGKPFSYYGQVFKEWT